MVPVPAGGTIPSALNEAASLQAVLGDSPTVISAKASHPESPPFTQPDRRTLAPENPCGSGEKEPAS